MPVRSLILRDTLMPLAFIVLTVETGSEQDVLRELRNMHDVKEAWFLHGLYDIIVKAKAKNLDELKQIVTNRIGCVNGVKSTLTMLVMAQK